MAQVLYEVEGRVAVVTLYRPEALNAFTGAMRKELSSALRQAASDPEIRAVVLTGAGRCLTAGADLKEAPKDGAEAARRIEHEYGASLRSIATMPKPVIAAVHGFAVGIGVSFVLASDLVVMGSGAYLLLPFSKLGLVPDGGLGALLGQSMGHRRAFEVAVTGQRLGAAKCLEWGLANRVVADDRVLEEAVSWGSELAQSAPLAIGLTKRAVRELPLRSYAEAITQDAQWQAACTDSEDHHEGVAAFLDKRAPRFTGH